ncbi:MAG: N,O-diacetyl muramidase, partial [Cyanobacteria bacterium RYN_339]|nr:N,O-diacetyl muramidase [Cyanobacteria bacterium RYN_339]
PPAPVPPPPPPPPVPVAPMALPVPAYPPGVAPAAAPMVPAQVSGAITQLQTMVTQLQHQAAALLNWLTHLGTPPGQPAPAPNPGPKPGPKPTPAPAPAPAYGQPWKPGPGTLQGADTSHWQSDATFANSIKGTQFTCIKATQGTHYVDPSFKSRWDLLGKKIDKGEMQLRVAYLFLDPGNGAGQAKHFLDTLNINGKLKPGTRLALDWEAQALSSPATLKEAADYIHKVTGLWPLIYTSASQIARAQAAVPQAPLWKAAWGSGIKHDTPFFQYSDGPIYDHDVFNGDVAALRRFAGFAA